MRGALSPASGSGAQLKKAGDTSAGEGREALFTEKQADCGGAA